MNEPLQPWSGPDAEAPEESSSGYLLMAGVLCGLIIAIGSHALVGHFASRPALAEADPMMVAVIGAARWVGGILAVFSLSAWLWTLGRR